MEELKKNLIKCYECVKKLLGLKMLVLYSNELDPEIGPECYECKWRMDFEGAENSSRITTFFENRFGSGYEDLFNQELKSKFELYL